LTQLSVINKIGRGTQIGIFFFPNINELSYLLIDDLATLNISLKKN